MRVNRKPNAKGITLYITVNGKGHLQTKKALYLGNFNRRNKFEGQGYLSRKDKTYFGGFKSGKFNGKGRLYYASGDKY